MPLLFFSISFLGLFEQGNYTVDIYHECETDKRHRNKNALKGKHLNYIHMKVKLTQRFYA